MLGCDFLWHSAANIQHDMCFCVSYLFFFGVELKALIQGAAVLLNVVLLLSTNTFRVLHHLLLDVTKQTAHRHRVTPDYWTITLFLWAWCALIPSANRMFCIFTRTQKEVKDCITSLWFCAPTQQWASHAAAHLSHTALELWGDKDQAKGIVLKELLTHTQIYTETYAFRGFSS